MSLNRTLSRSQSRSLSLSDLVPGAGGRACLLSALVLLAAGCEGRGNGASADATSGDAATPSASCNAVKTNINYATGGEPGSWTHAGEICGGLTDIYSVNVGCSGPSKPACGTCSVSGNLTYDSKDTNLVLEVYDENGQTVQSTSAESASPKSAKAPVLYGGTFSVRVRNVGGSTASYSLISTYSCP